MNPATVTTLLRDWRAGDSEALERLTPLVYADLRRIASRYIRTERREHTLQATALVNEAFLTLAGGSPSFEDRAHFLAASARIMRRVLIDHGRARLSQKRGGGQKALTMHEDRLAGRDRVDISDLDEALSRLATMDARKSDILVMHYFAGMTYEEIAAALGISAATVDRDLRFAKAWLAHELRDD